MIIVRLTDYQEADRELADAYMSYLPRINDLLTYINREGKRISGTVMGVQHIITSRNDPDSSTRLDIQEVIILLRVNR